MRRECHKKINEKNNKKLAQDIFMEFLDKKTEFVLKQCIDNENTYPQILCDMLT